jgi:tripartite ATP-independent transporter DctP family solute receptor
MKTKIRLQVIMLVAAAALLSAWAMPGCKKGGPAGSIALKASDDHPLEYPTTQGLVYMGKLLEERTKGRITLKVYPSAALGNETQTIENTQAGTLDINRISCAPLGEFAKKMGVFSMPFIFRDYDHFRKVLDGPIGEEVGKELEPKGMKVLAYYDSGARSFYNTKRPINTPDDLAGLKIRVQKSQVMVDLVNTLGAAATPMSFEDVYSSLQTGLIEGAENNVPSYQSTNHYEVAKFFSFDEHARIPDVVIISMKTWNNLSPEDQKIVAQAARDSEKEQSRLWKEYEKKSMDTVTAAGVKFNNVDQQAFRDKVKPMYDKYRADFGDLLDRIPAVK